MKKVIIKVRATGINFGCYAELFDAETESKLAETDDIRPHGMRHIAYSDGESLAASNGWEVAQ